MHLFVKPNFRITSLLACQLYRIYRHLGKCTTIRHAIYLGQSPVKGEDGFPILSFCLNVFIIDEVFRGIPNLAKVVSLNLQVYFNQ